MTKYRIKWTLSGESLVSEAHDAEGAEMSVEAAVSRASDPCRTGAGTEVETHTADYVHESTSAEDG